LVSGKIRGCLGSGPHAEQPSYSAQIKRAVTPASFPHLTGKVRRGNANYGVAAFLLLQGY